MVCQSCEKKLTRGAVPDVWKTGSRNVGAGQDGGKSLARNSYLESRSKVSGRFAPHLKTCRICKSKLSQNAEYCNQCAFSKAICAMCGVGVADLKFDKRDIVVSKKKKVDPAEVEEVETPTIETKSIQKKKKPKTEKSISQQIPTPSVPEAAGLALEAISVRTGRVSQTTIAGDTILNQHPKQHWKEAVDASSGKTYYYNTDTGVTQWTDPNQIVKNVTEESEWRTAKDATSGKSYLYNPSTGETKWALEEPK